MGFSLNKSSSQWLTAFDFFLYWPFLETIFETDASYELVFNFSANLVISSAITSGCFLVGRSFCTNLNYYEIWIFPGCSWSIVFYALCFCAGKSYVIYFAIFDLTGDLITIYMFEGAVTENEWSFENECSLLEYYDSFYCLGLNYYQHSCFYNFYNC